MIDNAIKYDVLLKEKMRDIWFKDKYKFYVSSPYNKEPTIHTDTYYEHQFVSVDSDGNILGYIAYSIDRMTDNCYALKAINFSDKVVVFGKDLTIVLKDIFEKFGFRKISFDCVVGNPIENSYDKTIERLGGRAVGIQESDVKLFDNKYYDVKLYEVTLDRYNKCIRRKNNYDIEMTSEGAKCTLEEGDSLNSNGCFYESKAIQRAISNSWTTLNHILEKWS